MGSTIFKNSKPNCSIYFSDDIAHSKFKNSSIDYYMSTQRLLDRAKELNLDVNSPKDIYGIATKSKDKTQKENAKEIFKEYGENFGEIISIITNKNDVDLVFISGGILKGHKLFLKYTKKSLKNHTKKGNNIPKIKLLKSKHEMGALGASMMFEE